MLLATVICFSCAQVYIFKIDGASLVKTFQASGKMVGTQIPGFLAYRSTYFACVAGYCYAKLFHQEQHNNVVFFFLHKLTQGSYVWFL